jgi:hypothetical protein
MYRTVQSGNVKTPKDFKGEKREKFFIVSAPKLMLSH